jgi:hypothetical protein
MDGLATDEIRSARSMSCMIWDLPNDVLIIIIFGFCHERRLIWMEKAFFGGYLTSNAITIQLLHH